MAEHLTPRYWLSPNGICMPAEYFVPWSSDNPDDAARWTPLFTAEQAAALRAGRDAQGMKRLELYAHQDDWPAIKALAEKLQRRRIKANAASASTACMDCRAPRVVAPDMPCHRCGCFAWVVRKPANAAG